MAMNSEINVRVRRRSARWPAVVSLVGVAVAGLTGCESKTGAAAVIDGARISDTRVNDYLTPDAQPIPGSQGQSTPARLFVLRVLVRNVVVPRLFDVTGGRPSAQELSRAKDQLLQGITEQQLTNQLSQVGLATSFSRPYLEGQVMLSFLQGRIASQAQLDAAVQKADLKVSISPRYGAWNPAALSVSDLSAKQLPSAVTFDGKLPGDVQAPPSQ